MYRIVSAIGMRGMESAVRSPFDKLTEQFSYEKEWKERMNEWTNEERKVEQIRGNMTEEK